MKLTDREFEQLSDYIKKNYGIFLKEDKKSLIETRLADILVKKSISSFSQLYTLLQQDSSGELKKEVAIRITTNYTYFMREEDTHNRRENYALQLECAVLSHHKNFFENGIFRFQSPRGDRNFSLQLGAGLCPAMED